MPLTPLTTETGTPLPHCAVKEMAVIYPPSLSFSFNIQTFYYQSLLFCKFYSDKLLKPNIFKREY